MNQDGTHQDQTEQHGVGQERADAVADDLGATLEDIENASLAQRAAAYSQVQEELRLRLEHANRAR